MKKLLYIILALCLLLTLAACGPEEKPGGETTGQTEGEVVKTGNGISSSHVHCVCCGKAKGVGEHKECSDKDGWIEVGTAKELTDAIAAATLEAPAYVALKADITLESDLEIIEGSDVYICLNGKKLNTSAKNIGQLHVTDCTGNGTWTADKNYTISNADASVCEVYAGNFTISDKVKDTNIIVLEDNNAVFRMYGGKVYMDHESTKQGACFLVGTLGEVHMYDGTITGANVVLADEAADKKIGGNISLYGQSAKLYMYGGTISDGKITLPGVTGGKAAWGGNIGSVAGAMYMFGGTVTGGYANGNGGNISTYNKSKVATFENCTISNGTSGYFGGNFYFQGLASDHIVNFKNAVVTGGTAEACGGNIFISTCTFTFDGGELSNGKCTKEPAGGIAYQGNDQMSVLKGDIKFENNYGSDLRLRKHSTGKLHYLSIKDLKTATDIIVSAVASYDFANDAPENHPLKAVSGYVITATGTKLNIKKAS